MGNSLYYDDLYENAGDNGWGGLLVIAIILAYGWYASNRDEKKRKK